MTWDWFYNLENIKKRIPEIGYYKCEKINLLELIDWSINEI